MKARLRLLLRLKVKFLPQSRELLAKSTPFAIRQTHPTGFPIFRSGLVTRQAELLSYWQNHVYSKAPWLHPSYGASKLLWASPTPQLSRRQGYGFPSCVANPSAQSGASQVPGLPFSTRCPQSPRESPANAHACCFFAGDRLHHIRQPGHSPSSCNEAESGSLALRLVLSSHKASQVGSPLAALVRLQVKQAIDMVDSFQSTR